MEGLCERCVKWGGLGRATGSDRQPVRHPARACRPAPCALATARPLATGEKPSRAVKCAVTFTGPRARQGAKTGRRLVGYGPGRRFFAPRASDRRAGGPHLDRWPTAAALAFDARSRPDPAGQRGRNSPAASVPPQAGANHRRRPAVDAPGPLDLARPAGGVIAAGGVVAAYEQHAAGVRVITSSRGAAGSALGRWTHRTNESTEPTLGIC